MGLHARIGDFGDVAAEQDAAIMSYFLQTDAVDRIESGKTVVVIGRKGSGKTALAKYFSTSRQDYVSESVSLRDYPWGIHSQRKNLGASDIETYVSAWRYLIAVKSVTALLREAKHPQTFDTQKAAQRYLIDNYGGMNPSLQDILRPKKMKLSKGSLRPMIMGNAIGEVNFESDNGAVEPQIDILTDTIIEAALTMMGQTGVRNVILNFDELDQGLSRVDEQHEQMMVGLILAARSFHSMKRQDVSISPIAYLRTDIWNELSFSDKNKISQSSAVTLEWDSDSLQRMIDQRIKIKVGYEYNWANLDDEALMRGSQSKWGHIVARSFLRPRDVIQFLNCAINNSLSRDKDADQFTNEDVQRAREPYSRYLKLELDDELGPHWATWAEAIQVCSELSTITFSREDFIKNYDRRKTKKNTLSAEEALDRLYQFSAIGYRRSIGKGGSAWVFQYSDPHAGWDNGATQLKVHLGLKEFAKLREDRA